MGQRHGEQFSIKMNRNSWKYQSRTGRNRRKLLKEYHNLNYEVSVEDAVLSQENMCRSSNCIVSGQAGVFRENIDEGSVSEW